MTAAALKRMSAAEFLAWVETQESGRYELLRGEIIAMAPERAGHARAKFKACRALADAIAAAGLPCEAFVDGVGVAIDGQTVYEPDALVHCGEKIASDALLAPAPIIIVEVLSPSTGSVDKAQKLSDYFRLPSLAHYLLIDLRGRLIIHYRRGGDGVIAVTFVKEGTIALDPPGLVVSLSDIFES